MIGILVITHGDFADGLLAGATLLAGEHEHVERFGLYPGEAFDEFKEKVQTTISRMAEESEGDGVLVMVDLFGGSPFNAVAFAARELIENNVKFECLTGVNMPMVLEGILTRDAMSLEELRTHCMESAAAGVQDLIKELGMR